MEHILNEKELDIQMPILGRALYLKSKSKNHGWFVENYTIIAYYIDIKLGFRRLVFATSVICQKNQLSKLDELEFLNKLIIYIRKNNICDFIYKAQGNVVFNVCPKGAECVDWGTYEVSLNKSEEELFASFNGKSRNVIRKAKKENVIVKQTDDVDLIYKNIKEMFDRQNSFHYPSYDYIESLKNNLPNNAVFFIAIKDSIVQGSLILLYDETIGYAMYAGSIIAPISGSLDLLHFEAMKFLQKKKVSLYDFVGTRIDIKPGSKQEGIDRFKKKFNPTLKQGYAFKVIINPFKHKIFEILVKIYFRVKGYNYTESINQIEQDKLLINK